MVTNKNKDLLFYDGTNTGLKLTEEMFLEGLDIYNYEEELGNLLEKYGPNILGCFLFSCNSF